MLKVLLVDDDGAFRASLHRLLRADGDQVWEAGDGNEALTLLDRQPVDVVVTDVLMPFKDGLQTIIEIRHRWPSLKIIVMSGGGFCPAGMYLELGLKLGATLALEKPFAFKKLSAAMREARA